MTSVETSVSASSVRPFLSDGDAKSAFHRVDLPRLRSIFVFRNVHTKFVVVEV